MTKTFLPAALAAALLAPPATAAEPFPVASPDAFPVACPCGCELTGKCDCGPACPATVAVSAAADPFAAGSCPGGVCPVPAARVSAPAGGFAATYGVRTGGAVARGPVRGLFARVRARFGCR